MSRIDKANFPRRRHSGALEKCHLDIGPNGIEDQIVIGVLLADYRDDLDLADKIRNVIGGGNDAAGKRFAAFIAGRDDIFLGRFSHRRGVLIFVDDGFADEEHAQVLNGLDCAQHVRQRIAVAQAREIARDFRVVHVQMPVDQGRR